MTDINSEQLVSRVSPEIRAMGGHRLSIVETSLNELMRLGTKPDSVDLWRIATENNRKAKFDVLPKEITPVLLKTTDTAPTQSKVEAGFTDFPAEYTAVAEAESILNENVPTPDVAEIDTDLDASVIRANIDAAYNDSDSTALNEDAYANQ